MIIISLGKLEKSNGDVVVGGVVVVVDVFEFCAIVGCMCAAVV